MAASQESAQLKEEALTFPPMPEALQQINDERARPEPDIGRITDIIANDVALAGEVLRLVNSPAFGRRQAISSVGNAVMLLGLPNVLNLVAGVALRQQVAGSGKRLDRFWDTASDVATVAATVAARLTGIPSDVAHTLGLFHDAGIPVLMLNHAGYGEVLAEAQQAAEPICRVEARHLGTNHALVGYRLARHWNLPANICKAIALHHNFSEVRAHPEKLEQDVRTPIAVLKLAEHISSEFRSTAFRGNSDDEWPGIGEDVLGCLNLSQEEYEDLKEDLLLQLGQRA